MTDSTALKGTLGSSTHAWTYNTPSGFTLASPSPNNLTIQTTTNPITLSPDVTALVIIDMQNFFLSPSFGRSLTSAGHRASNQLLKYAIPAARKAGIRIIWLNWGLTEDEVREMPAGVSRAFGFAATTEDGEQVAANKYGERKVRGGDQLLENGANGTAYSGLGSSCGDVEVVGDDGEKKIVDAGKLLMRDTFNTALYAPLDAEFERGRKLETKPDVWLHKNRMSGLWGAKTECEEFLEKEGIKTLLFTGVNTDQCVGGTLTDAFSKGYDIVLLGDGCGTTSPDYAQKAWEYNVANTFGFCTSCEELAKGVESLSV